MRTCPAAGIQLAPIIIILYSSMGLVSSCHSLPAICAFKQPAKNIYSVCWSRFYRTFIGKHILRLIKNFFVNNTFTIIFYIMIITDINCILKDFFYCRWIRIPIPIFPNIICCRIV